MIARAAVAAVLCALTLPRLAGASAVPGPDVTPYMHPQRLVNVGGGSMNLYCTGSGSPTVVLGTDGDDGTPGWRFVQPVIARHTRVCSYDSEGLGFSDPIATRLDAGTAAGDLHALLGRAGVAGPYVMVGYSLSGLSARLYADRYPGEVAGMVLVAPNVPYQKEKIPAIAPVLAPFFSQGSTYDDRCARAAERGAIRPGTPSAECIYTPPDPSLPAQLRELIQRQSEQPKFWRAFRSADANERVSSAEVDREQRPYGAMPLIVLTTNKDILGLPIPKDQKMRLARAWMEWHDAIAGLSSRGVNILIEGSTQSLPVERPAVVVSAIDEVVDQVRYGR